MKYASGALRSDIGHAEQMPATEFVLDIGKNFKKFGIRFQNNLEIGILLPEEIHDFIPGATRFFKAGKKAVNHAGLLLDEKYLDGTS